MLDGGKFCLYSVFLQGQVGNFAKLCMYLLLLLFCLLLLLS